jgi:hypothetical protein
MMKRLVGYMVLIFLAAGCARSKETFTVMQFNVWQEGTMVDKGMDKITDVILELQPGIVTFSEIRNYHNEDWITKLLTGLEQSGSRYYGQFVEGDVALISQFPIMDSRVVFDETDTDNGSVIAYLLEVHGQKVWVCSGHFDYQYYAVYLPRGYNGGDPNWAMREDGNGEPQPLIDVEAILEYNLQSRKDEAIAAFLHFANQQQGEPVILGMDLNGASHLDWTVRTKTSFGHNNCVIPWNNTLSLDSAGFIDSYRFLYPDEVSHPGITWPAYPHGYKKNVSWTPKADERDRIDYVFFRGNELSVKDAHLVGPNISVAYDEVVNMDFEDHYLYNTKTWPTDHMGLLVTFQIHL